MKAVRKLSTSIHNVGNMITNKISDVKTKGGTQLKLQVICPADGYPGKQITISTPDHQMLSVIIPKRVMPGRPLNDVIRLNVRAPPTSKPGDVVSIAHLGLKYNVTIPSNCPLGGTFMVQLPSITRSKQHQQLPEEEKKTSLPSIEELEDRAMEARNLFQQFDTDHNGILDYHEFTQFLQSLDIPKAIICEEITRVDIDHSHTIDFNEFTIYYNLLMHRLSKGNIKECLVHVLDNPFPGSLPDSTKVVHFLVLKDIGVALVSDNLKKRITIQFNSISTFSKKNTQELKITLTAAKGGKEFLLSFIDVGVFSEVIGEMNRFMAGTNDIRGQLASKKEELERLQREIDQKRQDLKQHMSATATIMDDQSSKIHAEARVEVLMEDTQKAADQHTQALAAQTEKKRNHLQQRLKKRQQKKHQNDSTKVQSQDRKETHARRATVVSPRKKSTTSSSNEFL
eukprot:g3489.t1